MTSRRILIIALLLLSLLFANWFRHDKYITASLLVFALPPLLLAVALWFGKKRAAFWAGVLALFWFCHGVMVAWSRPAEMGWALGEIVLSLAVVLASAWPGLAAKFAKRR